LIELVRATGGPRPEAVEAIGLIGDPAISNLLEELLSDEDPLVIFAAVEAIGNTGDADTIIKLKARIPGADPLLKSEVGKAVLKLGFRLGISVFIENDDQINDALLSAVHDSGEELNEVISGQLKLGIPTRVTASLLQSRSRLSTGLLVELINLASSDTRFEKDIIGLTSHDDDWVAFSATEALEGYDTIETRGAILDILENGDGMKVVSAIKYTVIHEVSEAVGILNKLQDHENEDIRATAARALNEFE